MMATRGAFSLRSKGEKRRRLIFSGSELLKIKDFLVKEREDRWTGGRYP